MKKIFTLLVALGALTTTFAQRAYQHNQQSSTQTSGNKNYDQPAYGGGYGNTVYNGNNQQPGNRNYGYDQRQNDQRDYARNDRDNRYDDRRFNERDRFEMERRRDYRHDDYRDQRFSEHNNWYGRRR